MRYTIQKIQQIVDGNLLLDKETTTFVVTSILFDSRLLINAEGVIFIALSSTKDDGHYYINALYEQGVRCFLVDQDFNTSSYQGANFIIVTDVLVALQQLAKYHRSQFSLPIIGITGSNGKTIVKEWLYQLLHPFYKIVRSPQSYNSQIGVPFSVLQTSAKHDLGIFEAGISTTKEMEKIAPVIDCNIGIFTNISDAHSSGFQNIDQKVKEKLLLFKKASIILYCRDNQLIHNAIKATYYNRKLCTYGVTADADLEIKNKLITDNKTKITAKYNSKEKTITIPFTDHASIENSCMAWLCTLVLEQEIEDRFLKLSPIALRMEVKMGLRNCVIINDSYNADLSSLTAAMSFMKQQSKKKQRTLILSDILQTGLPPDELYKLVGDLMVNNQVTRLIGIGEEIQYLKHYLPVSIPQTYFKNTLSFLKVIGNIRFSDETVLLKGARQFEFEKISVYLTKKSHKAVLEIDLNALLHNVKVYKSLIKSTTKLMAMVKAAAYGSGIAETAKLLESNGIDYFAVAYTDEAVELREQGITKPILVLNPEESSFHWLVKYRIEPEIYSIVQLKTLIAALSQFPTVNTFAIHIKLDTGMHRLGFEAEDITKLGDYLKKNPVLRVASIFSHLAASDNPAHDDFTILQFELFKRLSDNLIKIIGYQPLLHIINSSGIVRFPEYQMDMVRLGIGLYGIDSAAEIQNKLETVSQLKATISQIKTVDSTETVGYDRSGKLAKVSKIATINIGYADGFSRGFSKGKGKVFLYNQFAAVVGNVCMDMTMIDITDIPQAKVGDEVIVFGKKLPIQELATTLQTIPYEILTSISERVHRVYFKE